MSITAGHHPATELKAIQQVMIAVPFVDGMLRDQTLAALDAWDGPYTTWPLDPANPQDYAAKFLAWWNAPGDFMVIEQDIVPPPGLITEMTRCPEVWCSVLYHVGNGQYTTGLGMAKFGATLKRAFPWAGHNIVANPRGGGGMVDWISLNEAVDKHLTRLGMDCHVHDTPVAHLHYPEPEDG